MKSKKVWIVLGIVLAAVIIALITVICIRKNKPKYSYYQINTAFSLPCDKEQYVDVNYYYDKEDLIQTANLLNLYNNRLYEKGKSMEKALSLDEVLDFYSSEFDENGELRIMNLPEKIEDYLDWYRRGPKVEFTKAHEEEYIARAMYTLGCFSERKYTNRLSDVVIDDPVAFYVGLYVYNSNNSSNMYTEDEILAAMAGGSKDILYTFGSWATYLGEYDLDAFYNKLESTYYKEYLKDYPSDKLFSDLDLSEIKQLIDYMEKSEEK